MSTGTSTRYNMLNKAIILATKLHDTQMSKSGSPYILHPLSVMRRVYDYYRGIEVGAEKSDECITAMTVAVLHDVVEDTGYPLTVIEAVYGWEVKVALDSVSRRTGESYTDFILRACGDRIGRIVKICDVQDNLTLSITHPLPEPESSRLLSRYEDAMKILLSTG